MNHVVIKGMVGVGLTLAVLACSDSPRYTEVVSFGDSLSDAGTYRVGAIEAAGGGLFTVNGVGGPPDADPAPSYTWAQLMSYSVLGRVSCAARQGGFGVPASNVAGCLNYAQGGARVSDPKGTNNTVGAGNITGPLTEPVTTQIANYTASVGAFGERQIFTVQAGANDLFAQLTKIKDDAAAVGASALTQSLTTQLVAGVPQPAVSSASATIAKALSAQAATTSATQATIIDAAVSAASTHARDNAYSNSALATSAAIQTLGTTAISAALAASSSYAKNEGVTGALTELTAAATALASSVQGLFNKGARYVTVLNIPDASLSPDAWATVTFNSDGSVKDDSQQRLYRTLTTQFNTTLKEALASSPVVYVDLFSELQRQVASPAQFGLTNVKNTACNLNAPANALAKKDKANSGSSLVCTSNNLAPGDVSRYLFADGVHPTPYGHRLIADQVRKAWLAAGWL